MEKVVEDFPCHTTNPAEGTRYMTAMLIRGGGGQATAAGREWSNLGWYQAAAFAVARAHCCPRGPKLKSPAIVEVCELDPVLEDLGRATKSGTDDDVAVSLKRFGAAASCVATAGGGPIFQQQGFPSANQAVLFLRMIGRLRTAKHKKR